MMSAYVTTWWNVLCIVAACNVVAWLLSVVVFTRHGVHTHHHYLTRRWQLWLSAGYVAGCAFRSIFPVYDVPRICLVDSFISSVLVGRSVATLAELCFAAQWALMLREVAAGTGNAICRRAAQALLPLIGIAEMCSWYSVLTTANIGHVFEESLWAVCAVLVIGSLVAVWPHWPSARRRLLTAWCIAGIAYVIYMLTVDVPMYWTRWVTDELQGRHYLNIAAGWADVATRWTVSYQWAVWRSEVPWMSLYFSVGVWLSISLIHAGLPGAQRTSRKLAAAQYRLRPQA